MKKTLFTALRAMCVGAMTLFAVSCYDDSALWSEIEDLDARLTALEEKLNTEVATLNSKLGALETAYEKADSALLASVQKLTSDLDALDGTVDGYVKSNDEALKAAIEEYKKADETLAAVDTDILAALATMGVAKVEKNAAGNVVITFVDESTVEVGAADANANNTGLVTVVDGKWALVGADGKTTVLDAELHPDTKLAFKVNADNNELYVSYDDGTTWEPTGVIVKDATTINVVTAFEDGEDFVTLTVGGVEYQLPKYVADNSSLVMGRDNAFFVYGSTKTIELLAEGVTEYYVMTKPDGWKVALDGTVLTVTAPTKALIEMGAAELDGQVLVHATTEAGTCKVAKIDVRTGEAFTLSYTDGNVNIFNAQVVERTNMIGMKTKDFNYLYLGFTSLEEYLASGLPFKEFLQTNCMDEYDELKCLGNAAGLAYNYSYIEQDRYEEGWCEELTISFPLAKMVENVNTYTEPQFVYNEDEAYLLWLVPQGNEGYDFESAIYVYTKALVDFEVSESLLEDVTFNATFMGADEYIIGALDKPSLWEWGVNEGETYESALDIYMNMPGRWGPGGPLYEFQNGNKSALGQSYYDGVHTISLANLLGSASMDTEYYVWLLPYNADKPFEEYTMEDLMIYTCKTIAPTLNLDIEATLTIGETTTNSVTYTVTPPTGAITCFEVIPAEDFNAEFMIDGAVDHKGLADYLSPNYPYDEEVEVEQDWSIDPNTAYYLVAYSLKGTEYGVNYVTFTTPAPPTYETPDGKQWITASPENAIATFMGTPKPVNFAFDLGVSVPKLFPSHPANTLILGMDYFTLYGESEEYPQWVCSGLYGTYTVEATDETSGVIYMGESGIIPYSNYTETTCTFDFSAIFMDESAVADFVLVDSEIDVYLQ